MKTSVIKNNFSAGELSPFLETRTDIQQYANGARELTNVIPLVEGGVKSRPGTFFRSLFAGAIRLIPFVVNSERTYLVIFKAAQIVVYDPRTYATVTTLTSPYTAAQINDVQFVQYRYSMFMTHSDVPVHRFRCSDDYTNWEMDVFNYTHPPLDDESSRSPYRKGTSSGKDLGAIVTFTLNDVADWLETISYIKGDVVIYSGQFYQALKDSTNKPPSTNPEYWIVVPSSVSDVFSASDVGSYIEVNGGIIKISKFNNANEVQGEIVKALESETVAIERSWTITPPAFNATNGYPRCVTFFKQRLVLASTKTSPNKIWFSAVGGNSSFLETTEDADAFSVVSASGLSNSILFLEATRGVICLTSGGEYMISADGALTPTSVEINEHTSYGAYPTTRPCRVGNELLFVQRGGERLRALSYRYEVDGLVSPEISVMASHIGEAHGGIDEITYQQEPQSIVWCKLGDGKVASITFNRDQEVLAWAQHDFGGTVISMCSLPTKLGSDKCFMLINRNGSVCLEEVHEDANMDSQRSVSIVNNAVDVSNALYLGSYSLLMKPQNFYYTVSYQQEGNSLKILNSPETGTIQLGKAFNGVVDLFPPEVAQNPATTMFSKAKVSRVAFVFRNTLGPIFNDQTLELFDFDHTPMDGQNLFTGRHLYEGGSFDDIYKTRLRITLNKPLPFHMQALAIEISVNER
ncbi:MULTISPECIES: phage nozzle protein [Acinetobacter]|uniref:phage nozzle protein n=1 Tax=Acinetobacter TaxID=469 RepID=UPI0002CFBDAB|nr:MULTISPECIES: hypothetical protein [Acinetobacter]ENV02411.1 hypothetical protein F968_02467 [Acinetobacter sp. NIPH 817]